MKKILNILVLLLSVSVAYSQDTALKKEDLNKPTENSSANIGFGSVVNEASGKVNFSFPLTSISSRAVDYSVSLSYDGSTVFKQATYTARHMATGILGVGWSLGVPKITADTKMTGSRDDDTFYLNGIELVCITRPYNNTGNRVWEFKTNKPLPYIIKYYEILLPQRIPLDYWEVTDEKGYTYTYGKSSNTRESILAWGNWIGDGKGEGSSTHTMGWNLQSIKDQYSNELTFTYLKVEQGFSATSGKHTEASYLQQINSSTGERIIFEYGDKFYNEYYEPHTESAEPDAYQERYEKKYLRSIKSYNSSNELFSNYELGYTILNQSIAEKAKRFLTSITVKDINGTALPPDTFEYYTTGDFTGAIQKWTKPMGGSISYNYEKKLLFNNTNTYISNGFNLGGWGRYAADDYYVTLANATGFPLGSSGHIDGDCSFIKDSWDGRKWIRDKYDFPVPIKFYYESNGWAQLDNAKFVFSDNFYAALIYNRGTGVGELYVFHRKPDGTWGSFQHSPTTGNANHSAEDDPVLIKGDDFIAVGCKKSGYLYTYRWTGASWTYKRIIQGSGDYYYSAQNNFVLALNTHTGQDMTVTQGSQSTATYHDRYYIHYLDAEKNWQTKSWSGSMVGEAADISGDSYFYPCNSLTSFVSNNNPEYFIRWDTAYNIYRVDDVLGGYDDRYPFFPIYNNVFSGQHVGSPNDGYCFSFKQAAFNGSDWITQAAEVWSDNGFGQNRIAGYSNGGKVYTFNPNTSTWGYTSLPAAATESNYGSFAFGHELFIAEDRIYRINNWGFEQVLVLDPTFYRQEYANSGGGYVYVHNSNIPGQGNTSYYYISKTDNSLQTVVYNNIDENLYTSSANRRAQQFGGKYPFFSSENLRGKKLINNQMNQNIYDNVLSESITDDGGGNITKIKYSYDDSHTSTNEVSVVYGMVTITQAGNDTGTTNGYVKKYFDNGENDFTKAGLLLKEETYNTSGTKVADVVHNYNRFTEVVRNTSSNLNIRENYSWRLASKVESSYIGGTMSITTNYSYDNFGNITFTSKENSTGLLESSTITYADAAYLFVSARNLKGFLYKKINKVGNDIVSVEQNNWTQNGGHVYLSENVSGTSETNLRMNNQIEVVDNYGNIVQTSNGLGISNAVLMGYNYKYVVASIPTVSQVDIINALDVSYATLQTYSTSQLKAELLKLYDSFPMVTIDLFDTNGRKIQSIDARKNEINYVYDTFGRLICTTDKNGKIINIKEYHYKNQ